MKIPFLIYPITVAAVMGGTAANLAARPVKTVRVMAIGNSFSRDALTHLPFIAEAAGHTLITANAIILGGSLEDHARALAAFDADPSDRAGRPYGGKGLREMLRQEPWDVVTLQQASPRSFRPETFEPFAGQLVAAIRRDAPTAEIVVHQTWAYRDDHPLFSNGVFTVDDMYAGLRDAYDGLATQYGFRQIPSGDAFQHARLSPDWGTFEPDPLFIPAAAKPGELPKAEKRSLHRNFYWIKLRGGGDKLVHDAIHASSSGHYLLGCVWFEFLFGESILDNPYLSPYVAPEDTPALKQIAHAVVGGGHRPPGAPGKQAQRPLLKRPEDAFFRQEEQTRVHEQGIRMEERK